MPSPSRRRVAAGSPPSDRGGNTVEVIPRQRPLDPPAILFAGGGARGHAEENSIEAFHLARRLGATGIESDLHVTADGVPLLRRSPKVGGLRKRRVRDVDAADLPDDVVTMPSFYESIGNDLELLVHLRDVDAVEPAIALATRHRSLDRLWLAAADRSTLRSIRQRSSIVRLVSTTAAADMVDGVERHAARMREDRIDAILLPRSDWTGGRTALFHRFGRRCFATDAPHERMIAVMLHIGVDGVVSGYPDRMTDAAAAAARPDAPELLDE